MGFNRQVDLITKGDLRTAFFKLALPAVFMMLGVMLFELVDMFWVGRTNEAGVAAVSASTYMIWTIRGLTMIVGAGINTLVSRNAGQKNWMRVVHWFWQGSFLAIILGILFALLGFASLEAMLDYMKLSPNAQVYADGYLTYFYISLPLIFLFFLFDNLYRSLGNPKTSSIITLIALLINGILDPVLIFGFSIIPPMGVAGAALATMISYTVGLALFILKIRKSTLPLKKGFTLHLQMDAFREIIRIGSPIALSGALFSLIYIFITRIVSISSGIGQSGIQNLQHLADIQISAMGIGQRWESAAYYICMAASYAVSTMVGQCLGVNDLKRARQSALLATRYLLYFTFVVTLLFTMGGKWLAFLMMPDPEVVAATAHYLFIVGLFEMTMAFEWGLEGVFIGAGKTLPPFLISFPITLARIPIAWFFAIHLQMGVTAVWWTIGLTTFAKGLLFAIWFYRGSWMYAKVRA